MASSSWLKAANGENHKPKDFDSPKAGGSFFQENSRGEIICKVNQEGRRARKAKDKGPFLKGKILAKIV
ncbi:hypothetical protein EFR56_00145 [Lactobacillus delbrueckii]|nr:hypothetical protein [Lactobacillus delbrueckii]MCT3521111.1 hypothetical protein [Lactobacillus delbrueckii]